MVGVDGVAGRTRVRPDPVSTLVVWAIPFVGVRVHNLTPPTSFFRGRWRRLSLDERGALTRGWVAIDTRSFYNLAWSKGLPRHRGILPWSDGEPRKRLTDCIVFPKWGCTRCMVRSRLPRAHGRLQ